MSKINKIAILTSGGDAPGMNTTVRAIVKSAKMYGIETFYVNYGYKGLVEGNIIESNSVYIDDYINRGGTFIYSARYPEFKNEEVRKKAKENLDKRGIEALVVIGGDGSYKGAQLLHEIGVKTICLPGTIDNDISSTELTIGFSTALSGIVENVDRIRDTANSHSRCMLVEVMGRHAGDLALNSGIATGAELIITAENKMSVKEISKVVDEQMNKKNKKSVIVIISELLYENLSEVAKEIEKNTNIVTRDVVLSHLQRGGTPTPEERILSAKMGLETVELLNKGKSGMAISTNKSKIEAHPILDALAKPRPSFKELLEKYNKINQE